MSGPDKLALHLFNYPAWRIQVNGKPAKAEAREGTGEMLVPVRSGDNQIQVDFTRTWDRTTGGWISLLAAIFTVLYLATRIATTR
jgi:hypothetical protein